MSTAKTLSPSGSRITHAIAPKLADIPDGSYRGRWTGHEVRVQVPSSSVFLVAAREMPVIDAPCVVEAKGGILTVRRYVESDFEEEST